MIEKKKREERIEKRKGEEKIGKREERREKREERREKREERKEEERRKFLSATILPLANAFLLPQNCASFFEKTLQILFHKKKEDPKESQRAKPHLYSQLPKFAFLRVTFCGLTAMNLMPKQSHDARFRPNAIISVATSIVENY